MDGGGSASLADKPRLIPLKSFDDAMKHIQSRAKYEPRMLKDKPIKKWVNDTYSALKKGVDAGIADNVVPKEMAAHLDQDTFIFSGFKVHTALEQAKLKLRNADGSVKSYDKFRQDVAAIDQRYNQAYLRAEYQFAIHSSQSAAHWAQVAEDGDSYNLRYRTAGDEAVRESHRALNGTTLPPSDPFWDKYYPPNGWNCRCEALQVRKTKYPTSNPKAAQAAGAKATTQINKKGQNKLAIFRFNPGKQEKIFPPKHPYYKVQDSAKTVLHKIAIEKVEKKTYYNAIEGSKRISDIEKLTIEELSKNGHEEIKISLKNVDIDTAKLYAKKLVKFLDEYNVQGTILEFGTKPKRGNYGQVETFLSNGSKIIKVGKDVYAKRVNSIAEGKSRCDKENLQTSTLIHEFGHVIQTSGAKNSNIDFHNEVKAVKLKYREFIINNSKGTDDFNKNYLGEYATRDSGVNEFMAEAFQEYKNFSKPSAFALEIGEIVDRYFKK